MIDLKKYPKQIPFASTASTVCHCPTAIQISRMPRCSRWLHYVFFACVVQSPIFMSPQPPPRIVRGHIVLPLSARTSVRTHVTLCSTVLVSATPSQEKYLMQGFETCNTVQTCIEPQEQWNFISVIIAELRPLKKAMEILSIILFQYYAPTP